MMEEIMTNITNEGKPLDATDPTILLSTVTGSHLYGMNHAESDIDLMIVRTSLPVVKRLTRRRQKAIVTVTEDLDTTIFQLSAFMNHVNNGIPRMLDAMFSEKADIDRLSEFRHGFHADALNMCSSYRASAETFTKFDFKRRQHMLRQALNLNEALNGNMRFNPTLSEKDIEMITKFAHSDNFIGELRSMMPFDILLNEESILLGMAAG